MNFKQAIQKKGSKRIIVITVNSILGLNFISATTAKLIQEVPQSYEGHSGIIHKVKYLEAIQM